MEIILLIITNNIHKPFFDETINPNIVVMLKNLQIVDAEQ
jgi:hypothetical protein